MYADITEDQGPYHDNKALKGIYFHSTLLQITLC